MGNGNREQGAEEGTLVLYLFCVTQKGITLVIDFFILLIVMTARDTGLINQPCKCNDCESDLCEANKCSTVNCQGIPATLLCFYSNRLSFKQLPHKKPSLCMDL